MWQDLLLLKSELLLAVIIFVLLFVQLASNTVNNRAVIGLVNGLLALSLAAGILDIRSGELFGDMFRTNALIAMEKNFLTLGALIVSLQSWHWLKEQKNLVEFYVLLLSTLLGMFFMLSSNNLLMFYLGLELSTIPLTALANFDLERKRSSEAAFKFIISSAFSSGLLLFGISLVYGLAGSLQFDQVATVLSDEPLPILAFILILAGLAFKISAVPFHLWTADVYEGSPVAVTAYLSVVSKGAVIFVLLSILYNMAGSLSATWYRVLFILAVATMVIGNLFALRQQNVKRFLAFSSITQVGFILVGMSANNGAGAASVIFFVLVYIFSNLGAFCVVSIVSSVTGKERIDDYKGFYHSNPLLSWVLAISLFSLAGIPPMAGFFAKYFLLFAGAGNGGYALLIIAALNIVVSLYYYLKLIRAIFMDAAETPLQRISSGWQAGIAMAVCLAGILITGIYSGAYTYIFSLVK